ncbi:MAG: hypothetical protein UY48_C0009G0006 [Candidatus Gottesmanbacteria bacterium GW2011_GWB1_49_7]|uniref:Uncharacterized protein n=1 Tax=Candidatus Gottesmanbacteria bacterium GW2011_GWB1_49_7 TaxID=1618448 RepID=A0A0G1W231_9BACT|nr:MAG: hypothetical protein UY48_C0009G0006 [Candidatus Gottesmanbacteria bacterium GW2011_GWB1_49_7]
MRRKIIVELYFDLNEVKEILRSKYTEIPPEATIHLHFVRDSAGKNLSRNSKVVVTYDKPLADGGLDGSKPSA